MEERNIRQKKRKKMRFDKFFSTYSDCVTDEEIYARGKIDRPRTCERETQQATYLTRRDFNYLVLFVLNYFHLFSRRLYKIHERFVFKRDITNMHIHTHMYIFVCVYVLHRWKIVSNIKPTN